MLLDDLDSSTKNQPVEVDFDKLPIAEPHPIIPPDESVRSNAPLGSVSPDKTKRGKSSRFARVSVERRSGAIHIYQPPRSQSWKEIPHLLKKDWVELLAPKIANEEEVNVYEVDDTQLPALQKALNRHSDGETRYGYLKLDSGDVWVFSPHEAGKKYKAKKILPGDLAAQVFEEAAEKRLRVDMEDGTSCRPIEASRAWRKGMKELREKKKCQRRRKRLEKYQDLYLGFIKANDVPEIIESVGLLITSHKKSSLSGYEFFRAEAPKILSPYAYGVIRDLLMDGGIAFDDPIAIPFLEEVASEIETKWTQYYQREEAKCM